MWTLLKLIHGQHSAVNKITLKQNFFNNYKMSESDTFVDHFSTVKAMAQTLADENLNDVDEIAKVLSSLSP